MPLPLSSCSFSRPSAGPLNRATPSATRSPFERERTRSVPTRLADFARTSFDFGSRAELLREEAREIGSSPAAVRAAVAYRRLSYPRRKTLPGTYCVVDEDRIVVETRSTFAKTAAFESEHRRTRGETIARGTIARTEPDRSPRNFPDIRTQLERKWTPRAFSFSSPIRVLDAENESRCP